MAGQGNHTSRAFHKSRAFPNGHLPKRLGLIPFSIIYTCMLLRPASVDRPCHQRVAWISSITTRHDVDSHSLNDT
ncbi:hypothetical protein N7463_001790 [Penicillium fimorum]|uniref:Uncharacterized protein n=1 Tax=Penicillium fimorum TaxID=1882269 RepID=A0A9X0C7Q8_9EURO|nr:hypothetical protein N7463_001790 [Penicillium fimorum]